ncbi:MAG TPA: DUF1566 domain-containing protein [Polyangiaceae bacterium]|nr:DUF1566 domain-containing protein [Polyangiaceae bacterium]
MIGHRPGTKRLVYVGMVASMRAIGMALVGTVRSAIADAPPGRYTIAAGEVTDTQTGLIWQQGMSATTGITWAGAPTYCSTLNLNSQAWRLPSLRELQTLVDEGKTQAPAIDLTAFPGTPSTYFWTSNAFTGNPGNAWVVDFTSGFTFGFGIDATSEYPVRCVR